LDDDLDDDLDESSAADNQLRSMQAYRRETQHNTTNPMLSSKLIAACDGSSQALVCTCGKQEHHGRYSLMPTSAMAA
jgi:hypothetical protein